MPDAVDDAVTDVLAGRVSAAMALTRALLAVRDVAALEERLAATSDAGADGPERAAAAELGALLAANRPWASRALAITADPDDVAAPGETVEEGLARCRRLFDRAARLDPVTSVALYALGEPGRLDEGAAEIVALIDRLGLLGPRVRLLDYGCGTGRVARAVAPRVAAVTAVDLAPEMVAIARAACAGLAHVRVLPTSGRDLRACADATLDLVVAVDSLPYLYRAGGADLVRALFVEFVRALAPGGSVLVLNLSYRGDLDDDRRDAGALAAAFGLTLERAGTHDLRGWDGRTFLWKRREGRAGGR